MTLQLRGDSSYVWYWRLSVAMVTSVAIIASLSLTDVKIVQSDHYRVARQSTFLPYPVYASQ